jgi:methionyl aminopeptidase
MTIKTAKEIETMRRGGHRLAAVLAGIAKEARAGVTTQYLDAVAEKLIARLAPGARPSFKGHEGYPAATCLSVNNEVVHTIPSPEKVLHEGDILGIDIGLRYEGMYTDMARTVMIGRVPRPVKKLVAVTATALRLAIKAVRAGRTTGDIGYAIQHYVEKRGFSVVRSLVGHGVGHAVHEGPQIPNFGDRGKGTTLEAGMTLAIEPMVNIGSHEVATREDGWTIVTVDGSLSAHFEDTVVVTPRGAQILTK